MPPTEIAHKTQELKISEIRVQYPKQWLIVDLTQHDKYGWPLAGKVVFETKSRKDIVDKIKNLEGDLYVFYSGSIDDDIEDGDTQTYDKDS